MCPSSSSVLAAAEVTSDAAFVTAPRFRFCAVSLTPRRRLQTSAAELSLLVSSGFVWANDTRCTSSSMMLDDVFNITLQNASATAVATVSSIVCKKSSGVGRNSYFSESDRLELSANTSGQLSAHCSISDVNTFTKSLVGAFTNLGLQYSLDCTKFSPTYSVDMQLFCVNDDSCLGYTADAETNTLFCLLYSGPGIDQLSSSSSSRWIFLKAPTTNRTCAVNLVGSGTVDVYIRQTYLSTSVVDVFVGTALFTQCGGTSAFANGKFGRSSACGTYTMCSSIPLLSGISNVSVVVRPSMAAAGCNAAVGVLFIAKFSRTSAAPPATPQIDMSPPKNLSASALRISFPNRRYIKTASRKQVENKSICSCSTLEGCCYQSRRLVSRA